MLLQFSNAKDLLCSLVYPPLCALCETEIAMGSRLCTDCLAQLAPDNYCCQRCAMPLPSVLPNNDCIHCRKAGWRFSRVVALGHYRGRLKEAVIVSKKMKADSLRYALAEQLALKIRRCLPCLEQQNPLFVPVPNHWTRALSGAAPTAFHLASLLARHTGWPVKTNIVRRIRKTGKQGMLSITERKQNMRGAFEKIGAESLSGRHVLIVDDVLTSGATANELARQVHRCNPADITVVVVARATGR
jgi:ComF family protein